MSISPYLLITNGSANFGNVMIDSSTDNSTNPFRVQALPNAPQGYETPLKLILSANSVVIDTITIKIIIGKRDYLVWDPDQNNTSGPAIYTILQGLGYNGDYIDYHFYSFEHLLNYKTLFICAGVADKNFVLFKNSYEVRKILDYIERGGNVYLEGGECWYFDPYIMNGFNFNPYFGIKPINDGYTNMGPIEGVDNTFTQGMEFRYNGDNFYLDVIDSTGTGFRIFHDQDDDYYCGVANIRTNYKTVGLSFELSGLVDNEQSTKAILLDSIMRFFGVNLVGIEDLINSQSVIRNLKFISVYPNPFKSKLVIKYKIQDAGLEDAGQSFPREPMVPTEPKIGLAIYDAAGRMIKSFNCESFIKNQISKVVWDGKDDLGRYVPSGVYFVRLEVGGCSKIEKVIRLR